MLKWFLRLFRKPKNNTVYEVQREFPSFAFAGRLDRLDAQIEIAKRRKKKHSHLLAEKQALVHQALRDGL